MGVAEFAFELWALEAGNGGVFAVVTCCVAKIMPACSPVIGRFFDAMIVASIVAHRSLRPGRCWKLFRATLKLLL